MGKEHLNKFIKSGAILSTPRGTYFVGIDLFESAQPLYPCFYVQEFFSEPKAFKSQQFFELTRAELLEFLNHISEKAPTFNFKGPSTELFELSFNLCKTEIQKNALKKAVPYVTKTSLGELSSENIIFLLKNLISHHEPQNYLYFFSQDLQGFCGITPETLFNFKDNKLKTMALAGTALSSVSSEEFLNNKKEVLEHQFVVDFLKSKLGPLGKLNFSPTQVKKQEGIQHLLTLMEVELSEIDYCKIIKILHPTPALGGFPQKEAMKLLKIFNENQPRFYFGAPFGVVASKREALSVVLIRGLFWQKQNISMSAGCGVVFESEFEKEWNEVNLKINATEKNLGILN